MNITSLEHLFEFLESRIKDSFDIECTFHIQMYDGPITVYMKENERYAKKIPITLDDFLNLISLFEKTESLDGKIQERLTFEKLRKD